MARPRCSEALELLRRNIARRALEGAGALPSSDTLDLLVRDRIPPYEVVSSTEKKSAAKINAMMGALDASQKSPLDDHDIWRERLSAHVSYEEWVQFRTTMGRLRQRPSPLPPEGPTRDEYNDARQEFRETLIEAFFQKWVRTVWAAPHGGVQGRWTNELSDAFFVEAIRNYDVRLAPCLGCPELTAKDFRWAGVESYLTKEQQR